MTKYPGPAQASRVSPSTCSPGPKELLQVDGGHFGLLYHPGALFDLASRAERDFLIRHLVSAA
jgi:hypothetical protein